MMKIKYKPRIFQLIVVGVFCLITSRCERIVFEKAPFKVISLGPLSDEIPFEELGSGKILFQRVDPSDTSGFYIIDIDQRNSYGFTSNRYIRWPYLSPDGAKIVFVLRSSSDRNFIWNINCMNIDGTDCIPVTNFGGGVCPTWSTDGLKILYYTNHIDSPLYALSATENSSDREEMIKFSYGDDPDWFISPYGGFSMSPDGQLTCASKGGTKTSGILKIEPYVGKSGVSVLLPKNTIIEDPIASVFSPDGTKIAFAIYEVDTLIGQGAIWINSMDADGTNQTPLVKFSNEAPVYQLYPFLSLVSLCWSPDGKKLLFNVASKQDEPYHLMAINADGSGLIQVTNEMDASDYYVSWGR